MKLNLPRAILSSVVLAIASGILAATAGPAFAAGQTPTTTTLTASPNPPAQGQPTTLTATETPATAGTMTFTNGTTTIGSSSVNPGTGVATLSYTPSAAGTITATFTPADTADYGSSSGSTTLSVTVVAPVFTVSLTVSQTGVAGTAISLSSTVMVGTTLVSAGTVSWYDNGSATALNSTPVTPNTSGVAAYTITAGLPAGSHSIVAVFTPPSTTGFQPSQSAPQAFTLQAPQDPACAQTGSQCTATANIEATVPVGTLVLSTPYTTANPLNLGNLALNAGLTQYSAT
ncbi:MAG TPA: Ig-like domain repeat protein, partial [Streptosporangiaceae bacterium]|nr:Ig-like domain repeat protein [Streptosporangiaceae bacterium]